MNSFSVCSWRHSWFMPVPRQPNGLLKWQSIFSGALHESSTCWVYLFTELVLALCCVEMRWWWSSGNSKSLVTSAAFDPQRWELDTFPLRPSAYSFLWLSKSRRVWHLWLRQYVFYMPYFCTNHLTLSIVVIYLSLQQFPTHTHPNTIKHIEIHATLFVRSSKL